MIKQETAREIYNAYREIETGKKILKDVEEAQKNYTSQQKKTDPSLRNAFGTLKHFELGVPSGHDGHRLFTVRPDLAEAIVRAHIADKEAELVKVQQRAKLELSSEVENEC